MKQLGKEHGKDLRICLLEKGAEVGNHILSGAVIEPRALNELFPDWKDRGVSKIYDDKTIPNDSILIFKFFCNGSKLMFELIMMNTFYILILYYRPH